MDAPYRSDDARGLVGDGQQLGFPREGLACGAELKGARLLVRGQAGVTRAVRLPSGAEYAFTYVAADEAFDRWPEIAEKPWRPLTAVTVEDVRTPRPVVVAPVDADQVADCEFDL